MTVSTQILHTEICCHDSRNQTENVCRETEYRCCTTLQCNTVFSRDICSCTPTAG